METMTIEDAKSFALHEAAAQELLAHPEKWDVVRRNLDFLHGKYPSGGPSTYLREWSRLLEKGPDAFIETMVGESQRCKDLRSASPCAGVLDTRSRMEVLLEFDRQHPISIPQATSTPERSPPALEPGHSPTSAK